MSILDRQDPQHSEDEVMARARVAVSILEEPVMKDAWDEVERLLLVRSVTEEKVEGREDARRSILLIASVQEMLRSAIADGQYASR